MIHPILKRDHLLFRSSDLLAHLASNECTEHSSIKAMSNRIVNAFLFIHFNLLLSWEYPSYETTCLDTKKKSLCQYEVHSRKEFWYLIRKCLSGKQQVWFSYFILSTKEFLSWSKSFLMQLITILVGFVKDLAPLLRDCELFIS